MCGITHIVDVIKPFTFDQILGKWAAAYILFQTFKLTTHNHYNIWKFEVTA